MFAPDANGEAYFARLAIDFQAFDPFICRGIAQQRAKWREMENTIR
jgi:hypothetical protein